MESVEPEGCLNKRMKQNKRSDGDSENLVTHFEGTEAVELNAKTVLPTLGKVSGICEREESGINNSTLRPECSKRTNNNEGKLRKFKKIPIFVVDYHNDVLNFIFRLVGARFLPFQNNIIVHFDAHPDMVLPQEIVASDCNSKYAMLNNLSIENWIMPLCYEGILNRIVWIKNIWCNQMPVGHYKFKIGDVGDKLKVDLPLEYFLSEGNYADPNDLKNSRDVSLYVCNGNGSCITASGDGIVPCIERKADLNHTEPITATEVTCDRNCSCLTKIGSGCDVILSGANKKHLNVAGAIKMIGCNANTENGGNSRSSIDECSDSSDNNCNSAKAPDPKKFLCAQDASNFILDIDLDFFITKNPFLDLYEEADCNTLVKEIFYYQSAQQDCQKTNNDYNAISKSRNKQLNALKFVFDNLQAQRSLENLKLENILEIDEMTVIRIKELVKKMQEHYRDEDIDWEIIYDMGVTTDNEGLPHHLSSTKELEGYFENFRLFLEYLPCPPAVITVAKSSADNYCPADKAEIILGTVIDILKEVFGDTVNSKPIYYDDDAQDEIMLKNL